MSYSELCGLASGSEDPMEKAYELSEAFGLYRLCVHADTWALAITRGEAEQEAVCLYMVEHEKALVEFARRELAGASPEQSLELILNSLKYPIKLPARA